MGEIFLMSSTKARVMSKKRYVSTRSPTSARALVVKFARTRDVSAETRARDSARVPARAARRTHRVSAARYSPVRPIRASSRSAASFVRWSALHTSRAARR